MLADVRASTERIKIAWLASVFIVTSFTVSAEEGEKLTGWSRRASAAWWKTHTSPDAWASEGRRLHRVLLSAQSEHGISRAFGNKHFRAWLEHLRWLTLFAEARNEGEGFLSSPKGSEAFSVIGKEAPLLVERFTSALSTYDDGPRALEILCGIYAAHPEDAREFSKLAVALALVFDQPFPSAWPHPHAQREQLAIGNSDPAERFSFYVQCVENKTFLLDPRRLSVRELTFMVDTPLELRELQYVQQVKLRTASRLQDVYRAIPYEKSRLEAEDLVWPGERYRLIDIGRRGGICADQAFYMSQCGKAKGIPTVLFIGQGQHGGHAWVGFMENTGKWKLDVAKYRSEKYPVGKAFDPQSWRRISDDQLQLLVRMQTTREIERSARLILQWASMNPKHKSYRELLALARSTAPRFLEAWEMEEHRLVATNAPVSEREEFWRRWAATFRDQPDLQFQGQMKLIRILQEKGDTAGEDRLRRAIESGTKSKRFDLTIAIAADAVLDNLKSGNLEEAASGYADVIKRFKSKAGGHLFYNLVVPYVELALEKGLRPQVVAAMQIATRSLETTDNGTMKTDMEALQQRAGVAE